MWCNRNKTSSKLINLFGFWVFWQPQQHASENKNTPKIYLPTTELILLWLLGSIVHGFNNVFLIINELQPHCIKTLNNKKKKQEGEEEKLSYWPVRQTFTSFCFPWTILIFDPLHSFTKSILLNLHRFEKPNHKYLEQQWSYGN